MIKILLKIFLLVAGIYVVVCVLLYFFQEKFIFFPEKLPHDYKFDFNQNFEEIEIAGSRQNKLNGLLFKSDSTNGLIFYLHGNGGSLRTWGEVAKLYMGLHYDVFMLDYPGYGKSEGSIKSQEQLYEDIQSAYNKMKARYSESNIIVLGYSIGTGPAAHIAATNAPKLLILQAPYLNMTDMMKNIYPFLPTFLLKYKFETNRYIKSCKMPIVIFHGSHDEVIYYGSSLKLKELFKGTDTLITLNGQMHNAMDENPDYRAQIARYLSK